MAIPIKYNDPYYDRLDQQAARKAGIPANLLTSIRTAGERTNADRISPAGAKSVYQIIPPTRNAIVKKYGVDPYLSPENAALGAAYLLKESLNRNAGDQASAVAEYHGGTNRKAHGPITRSYVSRVMSALNPIGTAQAEENPEQAEFDAWVAEQQAGQDTGITETPEEVTAQDEQDEEPQAEEPQEHPEQAEFDAWVAEQQATEGNTEDSITTDEVANDLSSMANNPMDAVKLAGQFQGQKREPGYGAVIGKDIAGIGQGLIDVARHPIETAKGLGSMARGAVQSALPDPVADMLIKAGVTPESRPDFQQLVDKLKQDYGSVDAIKQTLYEHPVSSALDIAGGVGAARGLLKKSAQIAEAAYPRQAPPTIDPYLVPRAARTPTGGPVSGGAAATSLTEQARAAAVSPELQRIITDTEQAGILHPEAAARHIKSETLPVPIRYTEGQALGDNGLMADEWNLRGAIPEYAKRFEEQNKGLHDNMDAILEKASPDVRTLDIVDDGENMMDMYRKKDRMTKSEVRRAYKKVEEANGGAYEMDSLPFLRSVDQALATSNQGAYVPKEIKGMLKDFRKRGKMTFGEFENMRTNLATEARKYNPGAGGLSADGSRYSAVMQVRNALEAMPMTGIPDHLKPLTDAARKLSADRHKLIESDPAYAASIYDKVAPDDFINKFVLRGKRKNLTTMRENLAFDPLAEQTISGATIRFLQGKSKGAADDFLSSPYRKALDSLSPKLDSLVTPEIADYLYTVRDVAADTIEKSRISTVNPSNTASTGLKHLSNAGFNVAGKIGDKLLLGIPGVIKESLSNTALAKRVQQALAPGAGINRATMANQNLR